MSMLVCSKCGSSMENDGSLSGQRVCCPSCGHQFTMPGLSPTVAKAARHPRTQQQAYPQAAPQHTLYVQPQNASPTIVHVNVPHVSTNGLGTAGFVTSLVGLFVFCGLLSPVGLLFSLVAMLKPPRGMAIAGTVLGLIGSWWLAAFGFVMVTGFLGLSAASVGFVERAKIEMVAGPFRQFVEVNDRLPVGAEIAELLAAGKKIAGLEGESVHYHQKNDQLAEVKIAGSDGKFGTPDDPVATIEVQDALPTLDVNPPPRLPVMPQRPTVDLSPEQPSAPAVQEKPSAPTKTPEELAAARLKTARIFMETNPTAGKQILADIVKRYPGTASAKKAAELLEDAN